MRKGICFLGVWLAVVVVGVSVCLRRWDGQPSSFYQIRLYELLNLATVLFIACFVTYFINKRLNRYSKRCDFVIELLSKFQGSIERINACGRDYMNGDFASERAIPSMFKDASAVLQVLLKMGEKRWVRVDAKFHENFLEYKEALTDSPYGQRKQYPLDRVAEVNRCYQLLTQKIYACKLELFADP